MCGRYAITLPPEAVKSYFGYVENPNFPPRANIAPTQPVPVVRLERAPGGQAARHFRLVRWGFLPAFVKDPKDYPLVINARSETAGEKASFRNALRRRRCLFIADVFYEWRRGPEPRKRGSATPFLIRRRDGAPMGLAGLWESWMGPNGEEVETACILTTHANGLISALHERMPVVIEPENFETWLSIDDERDEGSHALLRPAADDTLEFFEIGTAVNSVANDGLELQQPVNPVERMEAKPKAPPREDPQGSLF
ncbi:MAG: putative response-associated peptidase [Hyphomicrobiales bacterium]|nr:putative response-associated peptidase [Hyphomicrobiales bacterium]